MKMAQSSNDRVIFFLGGTNDSNYNRMAIAGMSSFMTVIVIVPKLPECLPQGRGED
jgi:hypothetical protein